MQSGTGTGYDAESEMCLRMIAASYPDFPVRSWRYAQQGWDSITLLVNDDYIFRFARRPDVAVRLAREAALLPALADALPLPIPCFEYVDRDPERGVRFVGYRAIPGEPLSAASLAAVDESQYAEQLGDFLAALHSFPTAEARQLGVPGGDVTEWRSEYRAFYDELREHIFPLLTKDERQDVATFWEAYLDDDANFAFAPALIHRDLGPEHILCATASGSITGVIDWGDASIGDPAIDFTGLYCDIGEPFAQRVLASYQRLIEDQGIFWRRVRFYGAIAPFHEIRFGQYEGDEGHIQHGLECLRRQF